MTHYKAINNMSQNMSAWLTRQMGWLVLLAAATLAGCGGGEATTPQVQQINGTTTVSTSTDMSSDKTRFNTQLWSNMNRASAGGGNAGCGSCHTSGGSAGQHGFADRSDLDTAYDSITQGNPDNSNRYLNRTFPAQSGLVTKVASGHNCWLSSSAACANQMTTWITNWLQPAGSSAGTVVALTPPADEVISGSRVFPAAAPAGYSAVHNLLVAHCSGCHVSGVAQAQQPFFAVGPAGNATALQASYDSVVNNSKINLVNSRESRLYRRLVDDRHNCWSDCTSDGAAMLSAIEGMVIPTENNQEDGTQVSRVVTLLEDGISISGGSRVDSSAVAIYEFKEGSGSTISDAPGKSGVNLTLFGTYEWLPSWGIRFSNGGYAVASNSEAIRSAITATNAYTIEAWVVPANVTQQDANIVSFSANPTERFATLAQYQGRYQAFNRSTSPAAAATAASGEPVLQTSNGDALSTLQHVVVTYSASQGRRIYVNGAYTEDADNTPGAGLGNWIGAGYQLKFGGEGGGLRPWAGTLRKVVIHNSALTAEQILQNFTASVGQKYLLMFDIGAHMTPATTRTDFVTMLAEEFDNYSYLFYKPTYFSMTGAVANGTPVRGVRVGLNGRDATVGQAFASVNTTLNSASYTAGNSPDSGQVLSYVGTVIPKENGPYGATPDKFFLSFEVIGGNTATKIYNPTASTTPAEVTAGTVTDVILRNFDEINATMSALTGINRTRVATTFDRVYQGLPPTENLGGFAPSHQTGMTELAIAYCDQLANDVTARASYFQGVSFNGENFSSPASTTGLGGNTARDRVIDPLVTRLLNGIAGTPATQPSVADVKNRLSTLIQNLYTTTAGAGSTSLQFDCPNGVCNAAGTVKVVKATCAAAIASAPMLLQ